MTITVSARRARLAASPHPARCEITVMWGELLRRHPDIHCTGATSRLQSSFINGIEHLQYDL